MDANDNMYKLILILAFFTNFSTAIASIAVGMGILLMVYQFVRTREIPNIDKNFLIIFGIYYFCQIITAIFSVDSSISLREVIGEIHRCFPFLFAVLYVKNESQLRTVLIVILFSDVINDLAGLYQWFVLNIPRPYAFNHTATFFRSFLLMQIPMHIFIATLLIMPIWARRFAILSCTISIISLAVSLTRGAWLAFVCTCIIFMIIDKKHRRFTIKLSSIILICFMASAIVSPLICRSIKTLSDPNYSSNTERILMWRSSVDIFKDYPVHGVGQNMFQKIYNEKYISPDAIDRPGKDENEGNSHPHSNIFKVLSEGGLIGVFAFVLLHGYFFCRFYILHRRTKQTMIFSAGLTAFLILFGLQLEGLTDTNMNQVPIMREYWLLIGILMSPSILSICKRRDKRSI